MAATMAATRVAEFAGGIRGGGGGTHARVNGEGVRAGELAPCAPGPTAVLQHYM